MHVLGIEETCECDWPPNALKSLRKFNLCQIASLSVQVLGLVFTSDGVGVGVLVGVVRALMT